MTIWGKIIGATAGFVVGGPLGLLVGAIGGHFVDRKVNSQSSDWGNSFEKSPYQDTQGYKEAQKSITFTIAVVVLGAKMAKADGQVTPDEITAFQRVFKVPSSEIGNVRRLFNQAKKDPTGFEPYAKQVAELFADSPEVLEELLWCLAEIAKADHKIHPHELEFLETVADIFHIDAAGFARITALNNFDSGDDAKSGYSSERAQQQPVSDADYRMLGVNPGDDFATIKAAHRKLVQNQHPDRLIAQGLPQEFIDLANEKLGQINAAFDRIKAQHPGAK